MTVLLQFDDVFKRYSAVTALAGVSFAVERGEIVAVLGPNGAGKTTALEIALGRRVPDAGRVRLLGESPRSTQARKRVGVTPQESGFPDALRAGEILRFAAAHYPNPQDPAAVAERFGLGDLLGRRAGELSGGQSRRLALALAFVGRPELVVLDEPTTGLDVESRRRLWDVVRDSARDRSVLFTTHYLEEAAALATRVVVLDRGRVLFDGTPSSLRERFGSRSVRYEAPGGPVLVTTDDADEFVRELVRSGAPFTGLEVGRASLEEAFLSMTGGSK